MADVEVGQLHLSFRHHSVELDNDGHRHSARTVLACMAFIVVSHHRNIIVCAYYNNNNNNNNNAKSSKI
jgi:hypothetical protein